PSRLCALRSCRASVRLGQATRCAGLIRFDGRIIKQAPLFRFPIVAFFAAWPLAALLSGYVLPASAADSAKTLRVAFSIAETSFDPAFATDAASDGVIGSIFDAMLDYDYLARPVKLVPRALEAMPTVEEDGRSYICRIRKGVF